MGRNELVDDLFNDTTAMQRAWRSYFREMLGDEKLTFGQMGALFYIQKQQPVHSKKIADHMMASKSSIAQVLDSLYQLGYLVREIDSKDRRITYLSLSDLGTDKVGSIETRRKDFFKQITETLSDTEIIAMIAIQQKIIHQIDTHKTHKGDSK